MKLLKVCDEELLHNLANGDPVSFRLIYKLHWQKLYNIAFHITHSEADAEDIVQDVFSSLWYRRKQLHIKVALENYLVKAVKYTAFLYLKTNRRDRSIEAFDQFPEVQQNNAEQDIGYKELETRVAWILNSLPAKTRQVFSLSRFEGQTYPEIARQLNISVKAVEYHISMALKKLSKIAITCMVLGLFTLPEFF